MAKTILDYITISNHAKIDKNILVEYLRLVHGIAMDSSKSFFKLYELVTKSNDKKLKREAQKLFGKTVVEIAASLHKLNEIEKQLFRDKKT